MHDLSQIQRALIFCQSRKAQADFN